jgi:histone deacetylase complex regulatory component SIN3
MEVIEDEDDVEDLTEKHDESDEQAMRRYEELNEDVPGRSLSRNEVQFFDDLKKILDDENQYYDLGDSEECLFNVVMKLFSLYVEGICGADELFAILEEVFKHIDEFEQFKSFCLSREVNRRKYTWFCRNPDEITTEMCSRVDQSYTTVPDDIPKSIYSGQIGNFCADVTNREIVSIPQGSESSFTLKAKNKHEESLFKIEDERYEIDQAISLSTDVI